MILDFDLENIRTSEFGIGRDDTPNREYYRVPVDTSVQTVLKEMATVTWSYFDHSDSLEPYHPSERYDSIQYLSASMTDDLCAQLETLFLVTHFPQDSSALKKPGSVFCYFGLYTDTAGKRLIGMRRATQFKSVIKGQGRVVSLYNDTLRAIDESVFRLDFDFDLLMDSNNIFIVRPIGFERLAMVHEAILDAAVRSVDDIQTVLSFVDLSCIKEYVANHSRGARYVSSIRRSGLMANIDKELLAVFCKDRGVELVDDNGMMKIPLGSELTFLEILDRRRFGIELVRGTPEHYRAHSRERLRPAASTTSP